MHSAGESEFKGMTLEEIRQRNEERKKQMQARSTGIFAKWIDDKDVKAIKLIPPFEGYDREVKNKQGKMRIRPHYRGQVIGDWNLIRKEPLSNPRLQLSINDVRNLKDEDAKIITAPETMATGFKDLTDEGHCIGFVVRNGVRDSTGTTYEVFKTARLEDKELKDIVPKLTREDIAKLESEEKWNTLSAQELTLLMTVGKETN